MYRVSGAQYLSASPPASSSEVLLYTWSEHCLPSAGTSTRRLNGLWDLNVTCSTTFHMNAVLRSNIQTGGPGDAKAQRNAKSLLENLSNLLHLSSQCLSMRAKNVAVFHRCLKINKSRLLVV